MWSWSCVGWSFLAFAGLSLVVSCLWHYFCSVSTPRIELNGGRVLITGGSKGIGLEVARKCVRKGASVAIVARNAETLEKARKELVKECSGREQTVVVISCDVSDSESLNRAIASALSEAKWQWLSAVVCNAGVELLGRFSDVSVQQMRHVMNVNFFGTVNTIKACLPFLKQKTSEVSDKRRIVLVSSMLGLTGIMFYSGYCASKWAVRGLSDALAQELRAFDIYTCIAFPPDVNTDSKAREAAVNMPAAVRAISEDSGLFEPEQIGGDIANLIESGEYSLVWGLDGFLIGSLSAGMTMTSSLSKSVFQAMFGGVLRMAAMFYVKQWCVIAEKNLADTSPSFSSDSSKEAPSSPLISR